MSITRRHFLSQAVLVLAPVLTAGLCAPAAAQVRHDLAGEIARLDAAARRAPARAAERIAADFRFFAGGDAQAKALVAGLRKDRAITLRDGDAGAPPVRIEPATGRLGWGDTYVALLLTQETLRQEGISQPGAAQIAAALNGGTLSANERKVQLKGVLTQRAAGSGWEAIAQGIGIPLGRLTNAVKARGDGL